MKDSPLTRREFLKLIGVGSAALAVTDPFSDAIAQTSESTGKRPNVIVILADDLGYAELGCQGGKDIPTPNIDSISSNGVRFTNGYVSCPVCSPTRAGLMTGRYQQRFGHELNPGPVQNTATSVGLPLTETTLASRFKSAGYKTGLVGKWHLGSDEKYRPQSRGFDEFFGFLGGAHAYSNNGKALTGIFRGNNPVDEKEYLTEAFSREAVAFIERHKQEPFFLYLAFNSVHAPLQSPEKYLSRFSGIKDKKRQTFAAMLSAMDDAVGNVLTTLRKNGLEDNTLIFFLSDNGGPTTSTTSRNDPLKGYKGQVYEGGTRVPFMVQWKGKLPAGKVYEKPVISLDIAATTLGAAGIKPDNAKFDGVNIIPYINGESGETPHDVLYWRFAEQSAIRKGDWKLVKIANGEPELYNLTEDIGESKNLAKQKPDTVKELDVQLMKWDSELVPPLWSRAKRAKAQNKKKKQQP